MIMDPSLIPKERRRKHKVKRKWTFATLWLILIVPLAILASLFVYRSLRPRLRLRDDPPSEFVAARPEWGNRRRQAEQVLARAYWDCAVNVIQWHYYHGSDLPPTAPEVFQIEVGALPDGVTAPKEARDFYWQRLRNVWLQPESWKEIYGWDDEWFFTLLRDLQSRVARHLPF